MNAMRFSICTFRFVLIKISILVLGLGTVSNCAKSSAAKREQRVQEIYQVAAAQLGQEIARNVPAGEVIFLHMDPAPQVLEGQIKGLKTGLGEHYTLRPIGLGACSPEAQKDLFGASPLNEITSNSPDAVALITSIQIERTQWGQLSERMPELYAWGWSGVAENLPLFEHKILTAGMFRNEASQRGASANIRDASAEDAFNDFILVTQKNARDLAKTAQ